MIKLSKKISKTKYIVEEEFEEEENGNEIEVEDFLEKHILKILSKNKIDSKLTLTNLLVTSGIKDYELRTNISSNGIFAEIPNIGKTLKKLRFEKKIKFSILNGAHAYYIDEKKMIVSRKNSEVKFNWKT